MTPSIYQQVLLFDFDGTLLDSRKDLANAVNHARNRLGLEPLPVSLIASYIGNGVDVLLKKALHEVDDETRRIAKGYFKSHYEVHCTDETRLYPGVREVLDTFKNRKLVLVSNKPQEFCHQIMEAVDIDHYFTLIMGEESCPTKKPDPGPILEALRQLNCPKEAACMIGDWTTDVEAGKKAGVHTIACLYGIGKVEEVKKAGPEFLAPTPLDIITIIQSLEQ